MDKQQRNKTGVTAEHLRSVQPNLNFGDDGRKLWYCSSRGVRASGATFRA